VKVNKLVTFGGPHGGVSSMSNCTDKKLCKLLGIVIGFVIYEPHIQKLVAPASYYRELTRLKDYLE
jgi:palmitoyl-protein thioesterase